MIKLPKKKFHPWKSLFNEDHCKGNFQKNYNTEHVKPFYRKERY